MDGWMVEDFRGAPNLCHVCASFHFVFPLEAPQTAAHRRGPPTLHTRQTECLHRENTMTYTVRTCQGHVNWCPSGVHLTTGATFQLHRALLELSSMMSSGSHGFSR